LKPRLASREQKHRTRRSRIEPRPHKKNPSIDSLSSFVFVGGTRTSGHFLLIRYLCQIGAKNRSWFGTAKFSVTKYQYPILLKQSEKRAKNKRSRNIERIEQHFKAGMAQFY